MKWSSVKNILLGMLIVMNVFVICALFFQRMSGEKIPPVVISAAVETLENEGLICDSSLLPENYISATSPGVSFYTPVELSGLFFGSQVAFQTSGSELIAHSGEAELRVDDETFIYSTQAEGVPTDEKQLRRALKRLGLDMTHAAYSAEHDLFCCYFDGHPLFGMYLRARLDGDGELCLVQARWPKLSRSGQSRETGINIISHLPYFSDAFPGGGTVRRVRFGYSLSRRSGTDIYEFLPAWSVSLQDGRRHIFK